MSRRFDVRSVAIIGAGASGLAAAKYMVGQGAFERVVVFERRPEVGGIWNHTATAPAQNPVPQTSPFWPPEAPVPTSSSPSSSVPDFPTPMYDRLYVNIPHPLMGFTDLPIADAHAAAHPGEPLLIFPTRQTIQAYLESYADDVRHLIRFSTNVDDIRLRPTTTTPGDVPADRWEVHTSHTHDDTRSVDVFDAVVVAHGHYETTFVPAILGLDAFHAAHPGVVTHSKRYRNADAFRGQRVVVVGNSASGLDIASQINAVCTRPLHLSVRTPTPPEALARLADVDETAEIAEFLVPERGVRLVDGRVLADLDAVVFCTGYLFSLPFLQKAPVPPVPPGTTTPEGLAPLLTTGRRVHRLYDDLVHMDHPTLAFLSLPIKVIPYSLAQAQAAILARTWANTLPLPPLADMVQWERDAEAVRGTAFHVWPPGADTRYINATYARIMEGADPATRTGKEPPRWSPELAWMRTITALGKGRFEDQGCTATTLAELGFVYDPAA